jgi:hypothetical protein
VNVFWDMSHSWKSILIRKAGIISKKPNLTEIKSMAAWDVTPALPGFYIQRT